MNLREKIKALLFYYNDDVKLSDLAKILDIGEKEILNAIDFLQDEQGIVIVNNGDSLRLGTNSELGELMEKIKKDEEDKPLTKAMLETLSIILYSGQITKHELDEIRGVNTGFSLRNLMIRGLIQKKENSEDKRSPFYIPTTDTLAHIGVSSVEELEGFDAVKKKIGELDH